MGIGTLSASNFERPTGPLVPPYSLQDLFCKYSNTVYRICLRYTKNCQDAEDMVSEVFMKVDRELGAYCGGAKPMVWIYRIAVNHCLDHLRSRKTKFSLDLEEIEEGGLGFIEPHEDSCLTKITLERILEKINPATRRILLMSYVEGLSNEEIGCILKISRDAVRKKLNRFSEKKNLIAREKTAHALKAFLIPKSKLPNPDLGGVMISALR